MRLKVQNRKKTIAILIPVALATFLLTSFAYWIVNIEPVYLVKEMKMDIYIQQITGINVDTDAIHFGILPPGSGGMRTMIVETGEFRSLITLQHSGDISEWIHVTKNNFILEPYQNTTVDVYLTIPNDEEVPGYRDGIMRIIFKKI